MFRDPFIKKIGIAVAVVFILCIIGVVASPKCPGCGKRWDGAALDMKYCWGCQAEIKSAVKYDLNGTSRAKCSRSGCSDRTKSGSNYCYRHTCSVDGCVNPANTNTMFEYCNSHQKSLTCSVDGCWADRYMDSIYCGMHYPDGK